VHGEILRFAQNDKAAFCFTVIPSNARDLLFRNPKKKQIPRANPALGMTLQGFLVSL
jgi:hypothetical protein